MTYKPTCRHLSAVAAFLTLTCTLWPQSAAPAPVAPPKAPVRPVTNDYHGAKVVDPYQYMENMKDPEVQAWFKGQNDYARAVLSAIPGRQQLLARIRELDQSVPRVGAGRLPEDRYSIWKMLPTDEVGKLYLRQGLN
ncbi:MAG TPA: hypothetical protein VN648_14320, partial [Candidatus Methylomirabilis sp.]|nr:hypothetical protein [Candidatus Methylomirabilis sp.]